MRCFLAVELDAPIRSMLCAAQDVATRTRALLGGGEVGRGVPDAHHREVPRRAQDSAVWAPSVRAPTRPSRKSRRSSCALESLRAVPRPGRASMLWCVPEDPLGRCARLAQVADDVAAQFGVERETRTFTPHVTLVRARRPRSIAQAKSRHCCGECRADSPGNHVSALRYALLEHIDRDRSRPPASRGASAWREERSLTDVGTEPAATALTPNRCSCSVVAAPMGLPSSG